MTRIRIMPFLTSEENAIRYMSEGIEALPHFALQAMIASYYYKFITLKGYENSVTISSIISYTTSDGILAKTTKGMKIHITFHLLFNLCIDQKAGTLSSNNSSALSQKCITESLPQLLSSLLL